MTEGVCLKASGNELPPVSPGPQEYLCGSRGSVKIPLLPLADNKYLHISFSRNKWSNHTRELEVKKNTHCPRELVPLYKANRASGLLKLSNIHRLVRLQKTRNQKMHGEQKQQN